ncbi:hypothetical protein EV356DRAFT_341584 [Viridothelium virens]|uniref:Uncharacterized protein n=1 Tax=Viridothelium virens TaxID=1048519 RepID=A0A6A6GX99_VIRVR|nr:hypothetical protein EV356DRAFT_341584 [Viridothelium virens]
MWDGRRSIQPKCGYAISTLSPCSHHPSLPMKPLVRPFGGILHSFQVLLVSLYLPLGPLYLFQVLLPPTSLESCAAVLENPSLWR